MAVVVRGGTRTTTLRRVLRGAGVPVDTAAADLPVRDEAAVRPFLALLRCAIEVVEGAEELDPQVVVDVLGSPVGGADAVGLRRLRRALRRVELDDGGGRPSDVLLAEAVLAPFSLDRVGPEAAPARRVHRVLAAAVDALREGSGVEEVLWAMWSASGLAAAWRDTALGGGPAGGRADRDLDAVLGLFDAAARYVDRLPASGPAAFLEHVLGQDVAGDTLVARAPAGESVALVTPAAAAGLGWDLVVVAGVQEGVWPDLRLRGSLLGSSDLVDVVTGRPTEPRAARAQVRHDETRLFHVAVTRAARRLVVTAVRSEDEQPSPYLDVVDPRSEARPFTDVPRPLTLPGLVAELRRSLLDADPDVRGDAVTTLARLARAEVPGADPSQWWALRGVSDDRPRRDPDAPVRVSPSTIDPFGRCGLQWVLRASGGDGPSMGAQDIGTLVHELAHDLGDTDAATYAAELERRWGRLGLPPGWLSRRDLALATRMTERLATYVGEATVAGWRKAASEEQMRVALGRAHVSGTVDRVEVGPAGQVRVVDLKTGSSKPTRDEVGRHGQLGAYQLAVEAGAFADHGDRSGGAALLQLGKAATTTTTLQVQVPLGDDDDPSLGARPPRRDRRPDGGGDVPGDPREPLRHVPGQGLLPGSRRGEAAVSADVLPGLRWSAVDLAEALGQSYAPTPEQAQVIEAPLSPLLVVAGAGSGKTETMAARVVWLVANGLVRPDEVLGLTFTRKAAGELSERLGARLTTLREAGLWVPEDEHGAAALDDVPTVSTYHAYAGRIVREHGLRLGVEPESRLLTEAAAWQFAHEAVVAWDGPMDGVTKAESTVTTAVVDLAGEMAEHLVDADALAAHLDEVVATLEAVPKGEGTRKRTHPMRGVVDVLRERAAVVPLVRSYHDLKRSRDAMDFADQMALAARIATRVPQVGVAERGRFKAVLLDEFQDTSEAQLQLLRALFVAPGEPVPVTAVGDPHQSIYGWRGASSTTLDRFRTDFRDDVAPARVLHLSTSWRNDRAVLAAANVVAGPLTATSRVEVRPLAAREGAGPGHVAVARLTTIEDEARHVAEWVRARLGRPGRRTAAVLCRKRSQFDPVIDALEAAGVPYEVVGLGGLLHMPEVADLVALLHVVQDPTRGDRLMRLLTGPSCRLGAADLDGLGAWSRVRQRAGRRERGADLAPDASERASIVEALDDLPAATWVGEEGQRIGPTALERLHGLGATVRRLRSLTGLGLPELVGEAETALGLDIEVLARRGLVAGRRPGPPRRLRRRRRDVLGERRPADARRLPRLARGCRRRGARPRPRLGRGAARRRPGHDRPRGQGPGVGRRRGARPRRVLLPRPLRDPGQGRRRGLGPRRPQRQGVARRPRRTPVRPARRQRGTAPLRVARRARLGLRRPGPRPVHRGSRRARHHRGAPARLRGADPGPARPAPHRSRVGYGIHPAGHLALPGAAARQRPPGRSRALGRPAADRRRQAAEPPHRRVRQRQLADDRPRRAARAAARPGPGGHRGARR